MSSLNSISSSARKLRWLIVLIAVMGFLFVVQIMFRFFTAPNNGISVEIKEKAKSAEFKNYGEAIILDSTSYVIIPVVIDTERLEGDSIKGEYEEIDSVVNYLFINKNKDEKRKLFESDVQILSSNLEQDNSDDYSIEENIPQKKILIYDVVVKDTNNDKLLNDKDYSSIYISDLTGQNLKPVTPENRYVDYFTEDGKASKIVIGLHNDKKEQQVMIFNYKTGKSILYNLK